MRRGGVGRGSGRGGLEVMGSSTVCKAIRIGSNYVLVEQERDIA